MKLLQLLPITLTLATSTLAQWGGFGDWNFGGNGGGWDFGNGGNMGGWDFGNGGGNNGGWDFGNNGGNTGAVANNGGGGAINTSGTIKIMPVGDSITYGMGETGGYRKYLYQALTQKGYKIDMVGPEGSNNANTNGISYDDNHAGYSGFQIKEVPDWGRQQGGEGSLYNKLQSKNAVKQAQPDIITLIIGTNDMTANRNLDACASDLRSLVDYMLANMPANGVIFMGSIPEFTAYGGNPTRVGNYNNTVKKVAEEYQSKGKNVRFADTHSAVGNGDLGGDNLHPNGSGYKKMGNYWANVIDEYLKSQQQSQQQQQQPQVLC